MSDLALALLGLVSLAGLCDGFLWAARRFSRRDEPWPPRHVIETWDGDGPPF